MPDAPVHPTLLVVDDDPGVRGMLERIGRAAGFAVEACAGGREALVWLADRQADAALVDLKMPDVGGLDVLRGIRQAQPDCQVILMTGYATVETAIEAVKLGALDYLSKPLPLDRLKALLATVHGDLDRRRALLLADHRTARELEMCRMIGRGPRMQALFALVKRLAPHFRVALVVGETGVGKELVARALHQLGPRGRRRFVTVNCSAVVETLFESELFGHVKGAFTGATATKVGLFESADGGTLFLDEIGELPLPLQAKLLRAIETGEVQRVGSLEPRKVDVLVIAATNRDLPADVEAGRFRRDLLYRLNVVEISPPPLRDRREDIPYLTAAFLDTSRARCGVLVDGLTPSAEALLMRHDWPGNVRELRNVIERAVLLADGRLLTDRDIARALPAERAKASDAQAGVPAARQPANTLARVEFDTVQRALAESGGNKTKAAHLLGVSRRAFYRRLERYGLDTRGP